MPRCDGLPSGRCPQNVNNRTVKLSQGDLMLCPSCDAARFPRTVPGPSATSDSKKTASSRTRFGGAGSVTVGKGMETDTVNNRSTSKNQFRISTEDYDDVDNYCPSCQDQSTDNCIRCDICCHRYHQECTGLLPDVYETLLRIVHQTGWVCCECRDVRQGKMAKMEVALAKTSEELADVRVSLAYLHEELSNLRPTFTDKVKITPAPAGTSSATSSSALSNMKQKMISEMTVVVHRTLKDSAKRKYNVVVTGLPETVEGSDEEKKLADKEAFSSLCEQYLDVKPAVSNKGCIRLGQSSHQNGPRKLLVHLNSESSAADLLRAGRSLRHYSDCDGIYINPDLSPAEAKIAYEQRQNRRRRVATNSRDRSTNIHATGDSVQPADQETLPKQPHVNDVSDACNVKISHLSATVAEFVPASDSSSSAE